jgi:formamidopyrimidine-DNA glycosylase
MPELPEVETMRRGIAQVSGSRIAKVERPRTRLQSIIIEPPWPVFRRRILGRNILRVGRLGKRVLIHLDNRHTIVLEPRMTGLVLLRHPPNRSHVRLIFRLQGGAEKQFLFWDQRGLGVVRLLSPSEFAAALGPERIGPDALRITFKQLQERLGRLRRPVKTALLDQRLLAGIGNLYASEILHRAKIHPALACDRLPDAAWKKIHTAIGTVLRAAIRHQGSTLRDGTYRINRDEPGNFQTRLRVYQRSGQPCLQCGRAEIVRLVQAQRSTFFCPACQKKS